MNLKESIFKKNKILIPEFLIGKEITSNLKLITLDHNE
jgi:hypothetical protein